MAAPGPVGANTDDDGAPLTMFYTFYERLLSIPCSYNWELRSETCAGVINGADAEASDGLLVTPCTNGEIAIAFGAKDALRSGARLPLVRPLRL